MSATPLVDERVPDGVRWLTFDRPERLNAFTAADYRELRVALEHCAGDDGTRVVVLTGRGRAYSAGADRSLLDGTATDADRDSAGDEFAGLLEVLATFPKPLIAAVNGLAVGFGATMLAYCDLVVLAESARLQFPFTALGIVPEAGSSALLLGRGRLPDVTWAMLSSEWVDAATALEMGLAWRVVADDELVEATSASVATIAAHSPAAVAATKRLLTTGRAELARGAAERELREMQALLGGRGASSPG